MNTREIIAELRRSAVEDSNPYAMVHGQGWLEAGHMKIGESPGMCMTPPDDLRTFFLLVAHALEDEC